MNYRWKWKSFFRCFLFSLNTSHEDNLLISKSDLCRLNRENPLIIKSTSLFSLRLFNGHQASLATAKHPVLEFLKKFREEDPLSVRTLLIPALSLRRCLWFLISKKRIPQFKIVIIRSSPILWLESTISVVYHSLPLQFFLWCSFSWDLRLHRRSFLGSPTIPTFSFLELFSSPTILAFSTSPRIFFSNCLLKTSSSASMTL